MTPEIVYRFVQLSDIHFGQERNGTLVIHEDVRRELLIDAAKLAKTRGPAALVVVVGDIAYSGKEDEYKTAATWLDQVTTAVKCDETNVRVIPGNHDCDRNQIRSVARKVHRSIRAGTPKSAYADLEDMAKGPEEENPLLPKLKAYRDFAAGYDSDFGSVACPLWTKDFPLADGVALRLVGMNSVQVSDDEDRPATMILGNAQYILPEEAHVIHVVLVHHPLDWYMDKAEARPYLRKRARILMVGHEHIPDVNKTVDVLKNEWLDIYSGATNPPEAGAPYQFAYNWTEVHLRGKAGSHALAVNVFPRVWVPEQTQFAADLQRLAGRESAEFEIACPGIKPAAIHSGTSPPTVAAAAPASTAGSPAPLGTPTGGTTMSTNDDAAVAKLKFLFWRYLDWQQRLKVLVQADALPPSADRPVPQTMERLALETARRHGKLAAIWDAMMAYVPEARKQANPFKKPTS
jgi:predicted phosphodiesterase